MKIFLLSNNIRYVQFSYFEYFLYYLFIDLNNKKDSNFLFLFKVLN